MMAVAFQLCACGRRYTVPSGWSAYYCAVCRRVFDRDGGLFFPRRKSA